jgi:acetylornithine deacetylase/succinyl-diaminopimelate desuccinylase-like protein
LVWALNTLKDENEKIQIKGFYDDVRPPSRSELQAVYELDFDERGWRKKFGIKKYLLGLSGKKLLRKHYFEPTCTICGIWSGYSGPGPKTVLPAEARAKIDFRLVPDQKPEKILALLKKHLKREGFGDIEVIGMHGVNPARTPMDDPLVEVVRRTAQTIYGVKPAVHPTSAASGPMYTLCQRARTSRRSRRGSATRTPTLMRPTKIFALKTSFRGSSTSRASCTSSPSSATEEFYPSR